MANMEPTASDGTSDPSSSKMEPRITASRMRGPGRRRSSFSSDHDAIPGTVAERLSRLEALVDAAAERGDPNAATLSSRISMARTKLNAAHLLEDEVHTDLDELHDLARRLCIRG